MKLNLNNYKNKLRTILITLPVFAALGACNSGAANSSGSSNQQYLTATNAISLKANLMGDNLPTGDLFNESPTLNSVAKGSGIYVAVGDGSLIATSLDGLTWSSNYLPNSGNLKGVVYNSTDKLFYAIAGDGLLFTSANGLVWTSYKTLNPPTDLKSIMVVQQGNIVIGAESGTVFEINSTGRRAVTVRALDPNTSLISAANNPTSTNGLMVLGSNDGSIWYKPYSGWASNNWTSGSKFPNGAINSISFESTDPLFLAVTSSGSFISSPTGTSWSKPITAIANTNLKAVAMDPLTLNIMISGNNTSGTTIASSEDLNSWQDDFTQSNVTINDMKCFDANDCVAVGKNGVFFSGAKRTGSPIWTQVWNPSYVILKSGQSVTNENGTKHQSLLHTQHLDLVLQTDSNGVCYAHGFGNSWSAKSNTNILAASGRMSMEESGNLVVVGSYSKSYSSQTNSPGAYLIYDYTTQKVNIVDKTGAFLKNICG